MSKKENGAYVTRVEHEKAIAELKNVIAELDHDQGELFTMFKGLVEQIDELREKQGEMLVDLKNFYCTLYALRDQMEQHAQVLSILTDHTIGVIADLADKELIYKKDTKEKKDD